MNIFSKSLTIVPVLAAAMLLTACTEDEKFQTESGVQALSITVTDGSYITRDGTRASENGYSTEFTVGDACGLYVVSDGALVYENIKFTYTESSGKTTWLTEADLSGASAGDSYYLYYPYQEDMTGMVSADGDAEDFFSPLVTSWTPAADQSDYATGYSASDLMSALGEVTAKDDGTMSIAFTMSHRMALAIIILPGTTVYEFTNAKSIDNYIVAKTVTYDDGVVPHRMDDGTYRYIVNPEAASAVTGYLDENTEFTLTFGTVEGSYYYTYRVDKAEIVYKSHELQTGDYLLADGNLVGKDETLSDAQKAEVVAIVFWMPEETDASRITPASLTDDAIMAADYPDCTHGLAVAVENLTYGGSKIMNWQSTGVSVALWQDRNGYGSAAGYKSVESDDRPTDSINYILGYQNTKVIRAFNAACDAAYTVLPVAGLDEFTVDAPAGSTGWFIPSVKELYMMCNKDMDNVWVESDSDYTVTRDIVSTSLGNVGGEQLGEETVYWSSTEYTDEKCYYVEFSICSIGDVDKGYITDYEGDEPFYARAVCAF